MGKLFRDGQVPPQKVLEIIVGLMHRVTNPVYLGIISLEIRYSLARTQEMMELLEERGEVRQVTDDEKRAMKIRLDANLWTLTGPAQLSKARF